MKYRLCSVLYITYVDYSQNERSGQMIDLEFVNLHHVYLDPYIDHVLLAWIPIDH
jgi:hypothetical protein